MNKKLIISLSTIAAIVIIAIGATTAYFSNTETSTGNTFIAGAIDLKIDNECHYNGATCVCDPRNPANCHWQVCNEEGTSCQTPGGPCSCTWKLMDLDGKAIFNFADVKPGDEGEDTISLHVDSNPAWICAEISGVTQYENGCNIPEGKVDETCGTPGEDEGELWDNLYFSIWMDNGDGDHACNNIYDDEEKLLVVNAPATNLKWAIADSQHGQGPIRDACIGVAWSIPDAVGNIIQGDSVTGNITFNAYQARNNANFLCNPPVNYCGDGKVEGEEQCELPGEINCTWCSQSTSQCVGPKLQTRDGLGDCGLTCGCVEDSWGPLTCDKQTCKAACESDADCIDSDPNTIDTCNLDTCSCEHEYVPSCGNGILDPNEQCDDSNTANNDGCSETCQSEPAYILIHKEVVNNNICTHVASDFQMTLDAVNAAQDMQINVADVNSHAVSETNTLGYIKTYGGDCDANGNVTAAWNQTKTCNVINTCNPGTITVTKTVTNDDGGLLTVGSFTLRIDGVAVTSGNPKSVAPGIHTVSEVGVFGYSAKFSGDCDSSGHVTVAAGEAKYCTITNDDIAPSIELVKNVVGGSADPDDFDVSIDGYIVTSGSSNSVMANTAHAIDEEATVPGYGFTSITGTSFKGVPCPGVLNGTITLLPGDVVTCTITNTYLTP